MDTNSPNLVAYFSPEFHTEKIAKYLAEGLSADLQEIVPAIKEPEVDLSQYTVIFLGFPIWYDVASNVVKTFLKTREWDGQKIVLFATSGGSGIENTAEDLKQLVGGEKIVGARLFDAAADPETVAAWGKSVLAKLYASLRLAAAEYVEKEYSEPNERYSDGVRFSMEPDFGRDVTIAGLELPWEKDRYDQAEIQKTLSPGISSILKGSDNGKELLRKLDHQVDQGFAGKMQQLIQEKGLKEPEVYKAALVDRKLFSKIISDPDYKPSKDTCVALALALRLNLEEANDLLSRAGYTFSHSNKRDVILEYFFTAGKCNVYDVNIVLYQMGQKPLGRQG